MAGCTYLLAAVLFASALASKDGCPQIVHKSEEFARVFNNTCYLFVDKELYWKDARSSCLGMGGEMLSIRNGQTMQFIKSVLDSELSWGKNGVWLGARYYKGRWRWSTGEVLDYSYWASGEPSKILGLFSAEDCALMRRSDGWRWHDYLCGSLQFHYNYICEFPISHHGHQSSQQGAQSHDNGNMGILTIILATGGVILLILLLIFLIFRTRYRRKFREEPVVNFENRTYSEPLPPPPAAHRFVPPVNNMYLTPLEAAPMYEEVQKPRNNVSQAPALDNDYLQDAPPLPPPYVSQESLGACGGAAAGEGENTDPRLPLVCGKSSQESLDKLEAGIGSAMQVSVHNDYVDMNGSPLLSHTSQASGGTGSNCSLAGKTEKEEETRRLLEGDYSNLTTSTNSKLENVYERLP